ncbi:MarR family winged helix-turn-helix transcriptional regulator [Microbispora sp. ATCC PTA-5024]|uniref:MarR family winged helix-turn-helix transcriptional regulator n=1 Tax=Microbispora sp. ATCC PTA-5024 TaxID=316330 RepID=UPI0003DC293A|nr:MarR family transcriptional regulator [Microbispora sp. ATCC PTA-5024]ETK30556.1 MarR family transcriptional regulator [Microbispora sp. ATCC PTA-5024]
MSGSDLDRRSLSAILDDQMCFALYAASRAVTGLYRPILEELGLTYPQYLVLLVLWRRDAAGASVKDLGAALQLDYGTLTPLLKRLEANGLLRRERRADDERAVQITLTERGSALRERTRGLPATVGDAMGLDPDEFARTLATLRRIIANVTAYTRGGAEPAV